MRLLILGGTHFLGRHAADQALARGDEVTLFNRGKSAPGLFSDAEEMRGDRDGGLDPLRGRTFDAVLDTSGYVPRVVAQSAELLAPAVGRYLFVSSESVYAVARGGPPVDEDGPLAEPPPPGVEEVMEHYGGLKVACERVVQESFGDRATVVRPGLIVGPFDPSNRFTYWVRRMHDAADGRPVLAPAPPDRRVQFIDGRDLASWMLRLLESGTPGVFNADGPAGPLTMREALAACAAAAGTTPDVVWADESFLLEQKVEPWMGLPLWIPESDPEGLAVFDNRRAVAAGLSFRPAEETAADTLAWELARPPGPLGEFWAGISREREDEVLAAWREREGG
ncbi:MAG TPA: NAD-dependent epimerase/dehydratase family protein [Actinomycetota bacterium]|nr:NAD-dependent epimerase/dehydratase family protein [Actinomycetota bacterium]